MRTTLALILLAGLAQADTPKQNLAKGRKLANQKKYAAAIAAFEAGLVDAPDDPTLLSEAGFAAYLAKDYEKAEKLTRKALVGQGTPSIRGASFYNLGLIREARSDKKGAIEAYKLSLAARPHHVVRAALAKLDAAAASATDSQQPRALDGPFASLAAYCKTRPLDADAGETECTCGDNAADVGGALVAPIARLQRFNRSCNPMSFSGHEETFLAVKVPAGWFVTNLQDALNTMHCNSTVEIAAAIAADGTLRVPYDYSGECSHNGEGGNQFSEKNLVVLGVGPSKVPSATEFPLNHDESGDTPSGIRIELVATWKSGTDVTLTGKIKGVDQPDLVGRHTLVFP